MEILFHESKEVTVDQSNSYYILLYYKHYHSECSSLGSTLKRCFTIFLFGSSINDHDNLLAKQYFHISQDYESRPNQDALVLFIFFHLITFMSLLF